MKDVYKLPSYVWDVDKQSINQLMTVNLEDMSI